MDKTSGVYIIKSRIKPERFYIGSSLNKLNRKGWHLNALKNNAHHSKLLQRHYNKYGADDLAFECLKNCGEDELIATEQYFLDTLNPIFNTLKNAYSPKGFAHSEETKQKMKLARIGRDTSTEKSRAELAERNKARVWSEASKEKAANAHKGNSNRKGKTFTDEAKLKISISLTGKKHSEETKAKMSLSRIGNKSNTGRALSDEQKANISKGMKGKQNCLGQKQSEETKLKRANSLRGMKRSEETKNKLRLANLGTKHSDERKEANRQAQLGKTLSIEHKENIRLGLMRLKLKTA